MGNLAKKLALYQYNYVPEGLLTAETDALHNILPGPTLIELPGKLPEPLFVSVLLHGNEITGLKAIQRVLTKYCAKELPRSLAIFIGNISAAQYNLRRLDDQPDYNRIWPGTNLAECAETKLALEVYNRMEQLRVFASIDIHNNTGLNPHYACINSLDDRFLKLAVLFGRLVVYFLRPQGVQSAAFAKLCPSVTLECGHPDQVQGITHAFDYLESCLHLPDFPHQQVKSQDVDLFHTVAQVKVAENTSYSFTKTHVDLQLDTTIEQMNFTEIPSGSVLGWVKPNAEFPLVVQDEFGNDVTRDFFTINGKYLQITRPTMPSMLTLNEQVIRQDCLCYLMERISLNYRHDSLK